MCMAVLCNRYRPNSENCVRLAVVLESVTPQSSRRPSAASETRALPQVPVSANSSRPRLNLPATIVEELEANGHYNDIQGDIAGDRTHTSTENGHHTAVDSRTSYWRIEDPYNYIDIDHQTAAVQSGGGDQSSYEGLDPAVLSALRQQTQQPRVYAGLVAAVQDRPATQHTDTEMNNVTTNNHSPTTVSQSLIVLSVGSLRP